MASSADMVLNTFYQHIPKFSISLWLIIVIIFNVQTAHFQYWDWLLLTLFLLLLFAVSRTTWSALWFPIRKSWQTWPNREASWDHGRRSARTPKWRGKFWKRSRPLLPTVRADSLFIRFSFVHKFYRWHFLSLVHATWFSAGFARHRQKPLIGNWLTVASQSLCELFKDVIILERD